MSSFEEGMGEIARINEERSVTMEAREYDRKLSNGKLFEYRGGKWIDTGVVVREDVKFKMTALDYRID